jgi:hypothetical protein
VVSNGLWVPQQRKLFDVEPCFFEVLGPDLPRVLVLSAQVRTDIDNLVVPLSDDCDRCRSPAKRLGDRRANHRLDRIEATICAGAMDLHRLRSYKTVLLALQPGTKAGQPLSEGRTPVPTVWSTQSEVIGRVAFVLFQARLVRAPEFVDELHFVREDH